MWLICPPGEVDITKCQIVLARPRWPWEDPYEGLRGLLTTSTLEPLADPRPVPWIVDLLRLSTAAELVAGLTEVPVAKELQAALFEAGRALVEVNAPQVSFRAGGG
jgi:hypothetical protein